MKILKLHAYFSPFRGGEIIAYNTFKMLQNDGHEVIYLAADRKPYFEENYEYSKYFIKDITSVKAYLQRPWAYYYNFEAKKKVKQIINEFKPDLVHVHNIVTCFSPAVLECLKNIPTVMTVHDSGIVCPASTMMYKNKTMCNKLLCKNGNILNCLLNKCDSGKLEPSIRKTLRSYFINKNLIYVDKFVVPSSALKDLLIVCGINSDKIEIINNFITNEELKTIPNFSNKGYFLYLGSLSPEKGVNYLIEAIKDLPRNIELHIGGAGREENKLKNLCKEYDLQNVKFLGFLNREQVHNELQNCIATILPCNWFENFPTTTMESYINGKPVIASSIGGLVEQVKNNETGFLFEPTNVDLLKVCIMKYASNPQLAIIHGQNAYNIARTTYHPDRYYKELLAMYNKLLLEYSK